MSVILFTRGGSASQGGLSTGVCLKGVCLQEGSAYRGVCLKRVCLKGVCLEEGSASRGVCIQGGLPPGGLPRGVLPTVGSAYRGVCIPILESEKLAVHILLECFLVRNIFAQTLWWIIPFLGAKIAENYDVPMEINALTQQIFNRSRSKFGKEAG